MLCDGDHEHYESDGDAEPHEFDEGDDGPAPMGDAKLNCVNRDASDGDDTDHGEDGGNDGGGDPSTGDWGKQMMPTPMGAKLAAQAATTGGLCMWGRGSIRQRPNVV